MVLTAPGMSLADIYRFNSAIMFYPRSLYDETMSWTAPPRFDVPVCLLYGAADQHTLTGLVEEYHTKVEAPPRTRAAPRRRPLRRADTARRLPGRTPRLHQRDAGGYFRSR